MADFPVFQGNPAGNAGTVDVLQQLLRQKQQDALQQKQQDAELQRQILGVSMSDAAQLAPEYAAKLQGVTSADQLQPIVSDMVNVANARKQNSIAIGSQVSALKAAFATPGLDPSAGVAAEQAGLTSLDLPPGYAAQSQGELSAAATLGTAERQKVLEERTAANAVRTQQNAQARSNFDYEQAQLEKKQIAAEGRATATREDEVRQKLNLKFGLPIDAPMALTEEARFRAMQNQTLTPEQVKSNTDVYNDLTKLKSGKNDRTVANDPTQLQDTFTDLATKAASTGATVLPVIEPDAPAKGLWDTLIGRTPMRIALRPAPVARAAYARMHFAAEASNPGAQATMQFYAKVAQDYPAMQAALTSKLPKDIGDEANKALDAGPPGATAPAAAASANPGASVSDRARIAAGGEEGPGVGGIVRAGVGAVAKGVTVAANAYGDASRDQDARSTISAYVAQKFKTSLSGVDPTDVQKNAGALAPKLLADLSPEERTQLDQAIQGQGDLRAILQKLFPTSRVKQARAQ